MYTSWSLSLRIIQRGSRFMFNASFLGQKWPICYEEKFFQESLSCTSLCLSFSITFKKSLEWIQNYDNTSFFRPKMTQLLWMKFFPRKTINIIFIHFLASSIVKNWRKQILWGDPDFNVSFMCPKWRIFLKKFFLRRIISTIFLSLDLL